MWQNYFLIFDSEKQCGDVLSSVPCSENLAIDVLGDLSTPYFYDAETGVEVQGTSVYGWHVNVRCKGVLPTELNDFTISHPQFPKRVFA